MSTATTTTGAKARATHDPRSAEEDRPTDPRERQADGSREATPQEEAPGFIAVSNRLPIVVEPTPEGLRSKPGVGGLVTALAPVLSNRGGAWVGWPGTSDREGLGGLLRAASRAAGYRLYAVDLTEEEIDLFYHGITNEGLWPLFHDLPTFSRFDPAGWGAYQTVNRKFAQQVVLRSRAADYAWVHDYHLMLVGRELRELGYPGRLGFFLHIPFPPLDIFLKLPWRTQVLRGLLEFDLIGFQTFRDRRNFLHCARRLVPGVRAHGSGSVLQVTYNNREVRVGSFPISIDYADFARRARSHEVQERAHRLRAEYGDRKIVLGVDRLDYTKGIPERLEAFRLALQRYPELQGDIVLIQIAVPSRQDVPEYQRLRAQIEQLVGEINGQFTREGWVPIHYVFRPLDKDDLIAHYRTADIALITPLKDGMNLVAKEYCAAHIDNRGVLILSEFAGAAAQLHRWSLTVNPYDTEGVADAIYRAAHLPHPERRARMRRLRESIRRHNIFNWVDDFLQAGASRTLTDFPSMEEYIPEDYVPDESGFDARGDEESFARP